MKQTSIDSYLKLVESGELTNKQAEAYNYIRLNGPCTGRDIPNEGWKRVSELSRKGVIEDVGVRYCGTTRREATLWQVCPKKPETKENGRPRNTLKSAAMAAYALGYRDAMLGIPHAEDIEVTGQEVDAVIVRRK